VFKGSAVKRSLLLIPAFVAALTFPAGASARLVELGAQADPANPSCPADPCAAAVRITGYQGRSAGGPKNPYYIRRDGSLLAFTVTLSKPSDEQIQYFNSNFNSPPEVAIAVLRRGNTPKTRLDHRLVAQSELFRVDHYLGSSPTFVFDKPLKVEKGNWVGITIPTWAPMFANSLPNSNWWRSSRPKDSCDPPRSLRQYAMTDLRSTDVFGCTYHTERLLYSVTYVPDNHPTDEEGT